MATEILATGSTAANSADVSVVAGTPLAVSLKGMTNMDARVVVYLKDDAAAYNQVGDLVASQPAITITAPGTYRFTRVAGGTCGVFSG